MKKTIIISLLINGLSILNGAEQLRQDEAKQCVKEKNRELQNEQAVQQQVPIVPIRLTQQLLDEERVAYQDVISFDELNTISRNKTQRDLAFFNNLHQLEHLEHIEPGAFDNLQALQRLDLSHSQFQCLGTFTDLHLVPLTGRFTKAALREPRTSEEVLQPDQKADADQEDGEY